MKSLYRGIRVGGARCSVSESLLSRADDANDTALFCRNEAAEAVFGRLRIGTDGGIGDLLEDG